MRSVIYGAATSLDGFITGPDGSMDWLHFSRDVQQIMGDFWKHVDTVLMGRKTYDVAVANGSAGSMKGIACYVFSTTMSAAPEDAELVSRDAGEFVRALKAQPGKDICLMGGGELCRSLLAAGVVDEVGINVHPVLLGSGVPLFRDAGRIALTLKESRVIDGGCVYSTYRVGPSRG